MPFVITTIKSSIDYADGKIFNSTEKDNSLQSLNIAKMVGCLEQLGELSDYAAALFTDILDSTDKINDRVKSISKRTNNLSLKLPEVHSLLCSEAFRMSNGATGQKNSDQIPKSRLLVRESMPASLAAVYNAPSMIQAPPVHIMDSLLTDDELQQFGRCSKKYSNPEYFREEWIKTQQEEDRKLAEIRLNRRREREERRKEKLLKRQDSKCEKKKGLNWRNRYVNESPENVATTRRSVTGTDRETEDEVTTIVSTTVQSETMSVRSEAQSLSSQYKQSQPPPPPAPRPRDSVHSEITATSSQYQYQTSPHTTATPTTNTSSGDMSHHYQETRRSVRFDNNNDNEEDTNEHHYQQHTYNSGGGAEEVRKVSAEGEKGYNVGAGNGTHTSLPSERSSSRRPSTESLGTVKSDNMMSETGSVILGWGRAPSGTGSVSGDGTSPHSPPQHAVPAPPPPPGSRKPAFLANIVAGISLKSAPSPAATTSMSDASSGGGGGGGSILDAIKQGKTLRSVASATATTTASPADMKRSTIGIGAVYGNNIINDKAVSDILDRRRHLQDDSSSEDSDEDDEDWN